MKWKKYTIETTTAAEDFMSSMLMELGIEGIEIEDNIPLTKEDQADMFIDFLPVQKGLAEAKLSCVGRRGRKSPVAFPF